MDKKKKIKKKRSNKYQKKISLYGMDEKEVVKELLKSPPMPKEEEKKMNKQDMSHIYEYLCAICGNEFFVVVEDVPKPTPQCPSCGSRKAFQKADNFSHEKSDDEREK